MVGKALDKRSPGRPQAFNADEYLDRAVEMFWTYGYERVNVDRIARAVDVTKPALYRAFGDKASLLIKAVQRYTEVYGAPICKRFWQNRTSTSCPRLLRNDGVLGGWRQSGRMHDGSCCPWAIRTRRRYSSLRRGGPSRECISEKQPFSDRD